LCCFFSKQFLIFVSLLFLVAIVFFPFVSGDSDWIVINVDVRNEVELTGAISAAPDNAWYMIGVGQDIVLKDPLEIPNSKKIGLVGGGHLIGGDDAAAIIVKCGGELQLWGGVVVTHVAGASGRGVYVERGGIFGLCSGEISGNSAVSGGGVYNEGVFTMWSGIVADYCVISDNVATEGGGVYNVGTFNMIRGDMSCNVATEGGGVYVNGSFNILDGKITGNTATREGGGVYRCLSGTFDRSGGEILGNTAAVGNDIHHR
jgi:hypothetical protein